MTVDHVFFLPIMTRGHIRAMLPLTPPNLAVQQTRSTLRAADFDRYLPFAERAQLWQD
jgi:hypothetical protein